MPSPSLAGRAPLGGQRSPGRPLLIVSVHDVGPATAAATRRWATLMAGSRVPLTFLIVPGPWRGARFGLAGDDGHDQVGWLRSRQELGDEMSVHGWTHRADVPGPPVRRVLGSVLARGAGEFWALDRRSTADRTAAGLEVLDRFGLAVTGSTPPGWLSSSAARAGLADAGVQYVTDHAGLRDLTTGRRWWAPALCHRPAAGPAGGASSAVETVGRRVLGSAPRLVAAGASIRIALHPADLDRPGLAEAAVLAVRRCLQAGAEPTTYADLLRRLRAGR